MRRRGARVVVGVACAVLALASVVVCKPATAVENPDDDLVNPAPKGPVAIDPWVYVDYWLPDPDPTTGHEWHFDSPGSGPEDGQFMDTIERFVNDLSGTSLFNILTQYPGRDDQQPPVGTVHYGDKFIDHHPFPTYPEGGVPIIGQSDLEATSTRARRALHPPADQWAVYVVMTPYGVNGCYSGITSDCEDRLPGSGWRGYHHSMQNSEGLNDIAQLSAFVADGLYTADKQGIPTTAPHPNPSLSADLSTTVMEHEMAEAFTDPFGSSYKSKTIHNGKDDEIGDACDNTPPPTSSATGESAVLHGHGYIVQPLWSNAVNQCAPDYCPATGVCHEPVELTLTPSVTEVPTGHDVRLDVTVTDPRATDPGGTDTSWEDSASVTVDYPAASHPFHAGDLQLGSIAVDDTVSGHVTYKADADHSLTAARTVQHVCATLHYTDSIGNDMPDIPKCADITVVNDAPVLAPMLTSQVVPYGHTLTIPLSATDADHDPLVFAAHGPLALGGMLPTTFALTDNGDGTATIAGTATATPGAYPIEVSVSDGHHEPVTSSFNLVITRDASTLTYTGDSHLANGEPGVLRARLVDDHGIALTGRAVRFVLGAGPTAQTCSATTAADGTASCSVTVAQPLVGDGRSVAISAAFDGDSTTAPASTSATGRLVYFTGRATGVGSNALDAADTGDVVTPDASATAKADLSVDAGLLHMSGLLSSVRTTLAPGVVTANAAVASVSARGLLGPTITITGVAARSTSSCAGGSSGFSNIGSLRIGGLTIPVADAAPNTVLSLLGVKITLNEQHHVVDPLTGTSTFTVTAVHLTIPGLLDARVATANSGVHGC